MAAPLSALPVGPYDWLAVAARLTGLGMAGPATTALLATAHDPAIAQSRVFLVFAVLMVALVPLILLVPDHHVPW